MLVLVGLTGNKLASLCLRVTNPKRAGQIAVKDSLKICKGCFHKWQPGDLLDPRKSLADGEDARAGGGVVGRTRGVHLFKDCSSRSLSSYRYVSRWTNRTGRLKVGQARVGTL